MQRENTLTLAVAGAVGMAVLASSTSAAILARFDFEDALSGTGAVADYIDPDVTVSDITYGTLSTSVVYQSSGGNPNGFLKFQGFDGGGSALTESASLAGNKYFQFTLTSAYPIELTNITWDHKSGNTSDNRQHAVRLSTDGGTTFTKLGATAADQENTYIGRVRDINQTGLTDTIVFRFYGWGTKTSTQSIDIDNIIVNGVVPEPTGLALLALGGAAFLRRRRG